MELHGPLSTPFTVAFVAIRLYATFCALMVARKSNSKFRWFGTFWPASSLTAKGLRYRRQYHVAVLLAFLLIGLAFLVF